MNSTLFLILDSLVPRLDSSENLLFKIRIIIHTDFFSTVRFKSYIRYLIDHGLLYIDVVLMFAKVDFSVV